MRGWRRTAVALLASLAVTVGAAAVVHLVVTPTTAPRPGPAASTAAAPVTTTTPTVGLDAIASGRLEPAAFPQRRIERALLVAGAAEGTSDRDATILAVDAATGEWVHAAVPGMPVFVPPQLSPDGRSLVVLSWDLETAIAVVRLADGAARRLPVTPTPDGECRTDGVAWTADSQKVVVVSGCATFGRETMEVTDHHTWVVEIDVATGATRVVEHLLGGYPTEAYPTVSPDGRTVVYGVGMEAGSEGSLGGIRAVDVGTGESRYWPDVHLGYGDPWRDDRTVLAWDQSDDATGDDYVLLDTRSGSTTPLGIASLVNLSGYVAGQLVVDQTPWLDRPPPCAVSYCLADPGTLEITPWLDLPGSVGLGMLSPARDVLR